MKLRFAALVALALLASCQSPTNTEKGTYFPIPVTGGPAAMPSSGSEVTLTWEDSDNIDALWDMAMTEISDLTPATGETSASKVLPAMITLKDPVHGRTLQVSSAPLELAAQRVLARARAASEPNVNISLLDANSNTVGSLVGSYHLSSVLQGYSEDHAVGTPYREIDHEDNDTVKTITGLSVERDEGQLAVRGKLIVQMIKDMDWTLLYKAPGYASDEISKVTGSLSYAEAGVFSMSLDPASGGSKYGFKVDYGVATDSSYVREAGVDLSAPTVRLVFWLNFYNDNDEKFYGVQQNINMRADILF